MTTSLPRCMKFSRSRLAILLLLAAIVAFSVYLVRVNYDFKIFVKRQFAESISARDTLTVLLNSQGVFEPNAEELEVFSSDEFLLRDHQVSPNVRSGLYRRVVPGNGVEHRMVFNRDLQNLMAGIAWVVSHGDEHNYLSNVERQVIARKGKLFLTCSKVSEFAQDVLLSYGIQSKKARFYTTTQWMSNVDRGHTMLQVFDTNGNGQLFDLDNNCTFWADSSALDAASFHAIIQSGGDFQIRRLAEDARLDIGRFEAENDGLAAYVEVVNSPNYLKRWYRRVCSDFKGIK